MLQTKTIVNVATDLGFLIFSLKLFKNRFEHHHEDHDHVILDPVVPAVAVDDEASREAPSVPTG